MVNRVGCICKLEKYNRHRYVVTNGPLNTNFPNSNSHDKYNEKINIWSKERITTETFSGASNDKNEALCLFLAYFLHLVLGDNHIFGVFPISVLGYFFLMCLEGYMVRNYIVLSQYWEFPLITENDEMGSTIWSKHKLSNSWS